MKIRLFKQSIMIYKIKEHKISRGHNRRDPTKFHTIRQVCGGRCTVVVRVVLKLLFYSLRNFLNSPKWKLGYLNNQLWFTTSKNRRFIEGIRGRNPKIFHTIRQVCGGRCTVVIRVISKVRDIMAITFQWNVSKWWLGYLVIIFK